MWTALGASLQPSVGDPDVCPRIRPIGRLMNRLLMIPFLTSAFVTSFAGCGGSSGPPQPVQLTPEDEAASDAQAKAAADAERLLPPAAD
jgi:hypothetical protein